MLYPPSLYYDWYILQTLGITSMKRGLWFLALWAVVGWSGNSDALTIYRIGAVDLPAPELDVPYQFVQIGWEAINAKAHGSAVQMALAPDGIIPQQLDPAVNLTPLLNERGGRIETLQTIVGFADFPARDAPMFDGDPTTHFLGDGDWGGDYGRVKNKLLIFDLGGNFIVDRIKFYPRERFLDTRFIERFVIGTSDGDPLKRNTREYVVGGEGGQFRDYDLVYNITENTQSVIELSIPDAPIRQLMFEAPPNTRGVWEIAEFELYGIGFAPKSQYTTNVIDLGGMASLGDLTWSGEAEGGAEVAIAMRSGDDDDPNSYWRLTFRGDERSRFDPNGTALTLSTYKRLEKGEKAGITPDTENWSDWSPPYNFAGGGDVLLADRPRRYVQLKTDFTSQKEAGGRLDFLQFSVSNPPVATQALAELAPASARAGEVTSFTYAILPQLRDEDLGFDTIEIETPVEVASIGALRVDGQEVGFDVVRSDARGFELRIPRMDPQQTGELIEIDFAVEVFKFGTVFTGRISDSEKPFEVRQALTAGNADPLVDSNTLSVGLVNVEEKAVNALKLSSPVFTPNGDGINDVLEIEYELLNLFGAVPVALELYDLSGRRVGMVQRGTAASGRFALAWDGVLANGTVTAPGLYLLRLEVDSDQGKEARQRVIALAY